MQLVSSKTNVHDDRKIDDDGNDAPLPERPRRLEVVQDSPVDLGAPSLDRTVRPPPLNLGAIVRRQ